MSAAEALACQVEEANNQAFIVAEEKALLAGILQEDFYCLTAVRDEVEEGFVTVNVTSDDPRRWSATQCVVTRGPSGQHYLWCWEKGLTEMQENEGPELADIQLVKPLIELVQTTTYVPMED